MALILPRRLLISGALATPIVLAHTTLAQAADAPPALPSERSLGNANARLVVQEWFSLTCTHCAAFAQETFPEVKAKLINTGRIRYVFRDMPSDRVALMAAIVARALPPERYEPFILALFSSQQHWAFGDNVDPQDQLRKMSALAGLATDHFDKVINDPPAQQDVLAEVNYGQSAYAIDGTPTFVFGKDVNRRGAISYEEFEQNVVANGG